MTHPRFPPALRPGEQIRLDPNGPLLIVERVTAGAAYLRETYSAPRAVTLTDRHGKERTFLATSGGALVAVSPTAFVYRETTTNKEER